MNLLLVGMSHRTAPVSIRERYAVGPEQLRGLDEKLVRERGCDEAALISTCNRTEVVVASRNLGDAAERVHAFLGSEIGDGSAEPGQLYELRDADAARHVFRIASSLDSMVLGEAQILGQMKQAYRQAAELDHVLFQNRFVSLEELSEFLGAADVYVTPYLAEGQIVYLSQPSGFELRPAVEKEPMPRPSTITIDSFFRSSRSTSEPDQIITIALNRVAIE